MALILIHFPFLLFVLINIWYSISWLPLFSTVKAEHNILWSLKQQLNTCLIITSHAKHKFDSHVRFFPSRPENFKRYPTWKQRDHVTWMLSSLARRPQQTSHLNAVAAEIHHTTESLWSAIQTVCLSNYEIGMLPLGWRSVTSSLIIWLQDSR